MGLQHVLPLIRTLTKIFHLDVPDNHIRQRSRRVTDAAAVHVGGMVLELLDALNLIDEANDRKAHRHDK